MNHSEKPELHPAPNSKNRNYMLQIRKTGGPKELSFESTDPPRTVTRWSKTVIIPFRSGQFIVQFYHILLGTLAPKLFFQEFFRFSSFSKSEHVIPPYESLTILTLRSDIITHLYLSYSTMPLFSKQEFFRFSNFSNLEHVIPTYESLTILISKFLNIIHLYPPYSTSHVSSFKTQFFRFSSFSIFEACNSISCITNHFNYKISKHYSLVPSLLNYASTLKKK